MERTGCEGIIILWEFSFFHIVAMILRKSALMCNSCKQRIQNGIESVLLSDFNVSCVLYSVFNCLFVFIFSISVLFPDLLSLKICAKI